MGLFATGLQTCHSSALRRGNTNVSAGLPTSPCCEFKFPFILTTDSYVPTPGWLIKVSEPCRHSVCPHRDLNTLCRAQLSIAIFLTQATNNSEMVSPSCGQKDIYQAEFYLLRVSYSQEAQALDLTSVVLTGLSSSCLAGSLQSPRTQRLETLTLRL